MAVLQWISSFLDSFFSLMSTFRPQDFLDILLVAFIVYNGIKIIRETRAIQLLKGLILLAIIYLVVNILDMQAMIKENVLISLGCDGSATNDSSNLLDSLRYACSGESGVCIVFGSHVIAGTRARKSRTNSYNAFTSLNFPDLASIHESRVVRYIPWEDQGEPVADGPEADA